jgi:hypothetical protein
MYWLLRRKSKLYTSIDLLIYKTILKPTPGYDLHFQHRNPIMLPIESFVRDSGCTLVSAEYGYPKGSPNTNS